MARLWKEITVGSEVCGKCGATHSCTYRTCKRCYDTMHCPKCGMWNGWVTDRTTCGMSFGREFCTNKPTIRKCGECSKKSLQKSGGPN